jgi:competence ComEA-like helix-hairpin-helix protein
VNRGRQWLAVLLTLWLALGLGVAPGQAGSGQININTAGVKEFESLPMIGEARAIIRYRQTNGDFGSVDDLRRIPEIGDKTFQAIKPYLALSGSSTPVSKPARTSVEAVPTIVPQPGEIRLLTDQDYFPALQDLIAHATSSIDVVMFLFKATDSGQNRAAALSRDLIAARKRGVMVTVLLEKSDYDPKLNRENERVGTRLKKQGVAVRFDSKEVTTHAKIVVIDHRYSLVGSHNFTASALSYNHEASLLVDNPALADELLEYMKRIR